MTIEITDSKTVQDVQREFSSRYPSLKIEFFQSSHEQQAASEGEPCLPEKMIGTIRQSHFASTIEVNSDRETGSLEQEFENRFGLHAQIYRKQADGWIQTIGTDTLSLAEQDRISRELSFRSGHATTESGNL